MLTSFLEELYKLGAISEKEAAVSHEEAQRSLDRYDALENSKFTPGQVGRYAGVGAAGGIASGVAKDLIQKGKVFDGQTSLKGIARHAAGTAVSGAMTAGAIPLIRNHMDRSVERATLQRYLKQQQQSKVAFTLVELLAAQTAGSTLGGGVAGAVKGGPGHRVSGALRGAVGAGVGSGLGAAGSFAGLSAAESARLNQFGMGGVLAAGMGGAALGGLAGYKALTSGLGKKAAATGITPAKRWSANEYADMGKMSTFELSQYSSKLPKEETVPESKLAFALFSLMAKTALATTPAGRLSQAKQVGLPKMTPPPGPSISQVSRTFGPPMPGAVKGGIGKGF